MNYYRMYVGVSYRGQAKLNSSYFVGESELFNSVDSAEKWLVKKLEGRLRSIYFYKSFSYAIRTDEGWIKGNLSTKIK